VGWAGYVGEYQCELNPVQFDETPPNLTRGRQFAEHTDEIVRELWKGDEESSS